MRIIAALALFAIVAGSTVIAAPSHAAEKTCLRSGLHYPACETPEEAALRKGCAKLAGVPADEAGYIKSPRWRRGLDMDCNVFVGEHSRLPNAAEIKQLIAAGKKEDDEENARIMAEPVAPLPPLTACVVGALQYLPNETPEKAVWECTKTVTPLR